MIGGIQNYTSYTGYANNYGYSDSNNFSVNGINTSDEKGERVNPGRKSSPSECQTCKERKYQDGSDENVSFKSAAHISPQAAGNAVRAHEGEHVANAYSKAAKNNGEVLRASVTIKTAICPECGTTYVSGGTTDTVIKYNNEDNPYQKNKKNLDAMGLVGQNIDVAV